MVVTIKQFVDTFRVNAKKGWTSLAVIAAFLAVFVISWFLGSSETINIIGYEGTENEGFWAQFTDMLIFASYALFVGLALTIVGASLYRKFK